MLSSGACRPVLVLVMAINCREKECVRQELVRKSTLRHRRRFPSISQTVDRKERTAQVFPFYQQSEAAHLSQKGNGDVCIKKENSHLKIAIRLVHHSFQALAVRVRLEGPKLRCLRVND